MSEIFHAVARCRWCGGRFVQFFAQWICENPVCAERQKAHAILKTTVTPDSSPYFFLPLPLQVDTEEHPAKRLLVWGPVGISKSFGGRMHLYKRCRKIPGYRALLLRCTYDQLYKNHLQFMPKEARDLGDAKFVAGNPKQMQFENDSIVFMGYCDDEADIAQHLGPEYDEILFEQGEGFLPKAISEISARDRGASPSRESRARLNLPTGGRTRILANIGGRGWLFLRDHYIDRTPDRVEYPHYDAKFYGHITGDIRDNPYLPEDFIASTLGGLNADRYAQLAEGDLSVFPGQFFHGFDVAQHVVAMEAE